MRSKMTYGTSARYRIQIPLQHGVYRSRLMTRFFKYWLNEMRRNLCPVQQDAGEWWLLSNMQRAAISVKVHDSHCEREVPILGS